MSVRHLFGVLLLTGPVLCANAQSTGPLAVEDRSVQSAGQSGGTVSDEGLMLLMQQLQQYEQEISSLRGQLEELTHQVDQMQRAERERYLDLDTRINALAETTLPASESEVPAASVESAPQAAPVDPAQDRAAYMAARDKLLASDFGAAITAFEAYLSDFASGQFRAFAHFWLGEAYRSQGSDGREPAEQHFRAVIEQFPDSSKVPSALYKLAVLEAESGDVARAKVTLNRILLQHPNAHEAELARAMLDQLGG